MLPKQTKEARVMTPEEKTALLNKAASRPDWMTAKCAAILALNTTMRGCELRDFAGRMLICSKRL
jgi:hypothetical protein